MKIGVITDIHSNIEALTAVFNELDKKKVDKIICLGDIIGIGPHPYECVDFLMQRKDMMLSWILGNHENYLIVGIPKTHHSIPNGNPTKQIEYDCYSWNHGKLNKEQIDFLTKRPKEDTLIIDGVKIVIEHYPYKEDYSFNTYIENPSFDEIKSLFRCKDGNIYLYGHTHVKCISEKDNILYINPGSVGCPLNTSKALYGIIDIENGKYSYQSFEAIYDVKHVISDIEALNYPMNKFMIWRFYDKSYEYEDD